MRASKNQQKHVLRQLFDSDALKKQDVCFRAYIREE